MAIMLFTVINGLGVAFLMYVVVQFWKEEHRPLKPAVRYKVMEFPVRERPTVIVATRLVSGRLSVISRQPREAALQDATSHGD